MVKKSIITQKELQDLLDSDDELPNTYSEIAEIPAYQDNNRFNHILARNKKIVEPPKSPLGGKSHNKSFDFISSSDTSNSTVSNNLLVKKKKIVQPPQSPLSKQSDKFIDLIHSSNKNNSTVLKRNKKIYQPPESPLSEKSNNNIELICSSDTDNSTVLNKKIQPTESLLSEKSNKSIDLIHSSNKDNSTELSFFPDVTHDQEYFENRLLINKGVLSHQDIVCIKCIEATENNSTIIWFINYLLYKDMQSKYTYHLSSCLVGDLENHVNNHDKDNIDINECDFNLEIVIKCK